MSWRVALMGASAVSASVGLAIALFGAPGATREAGEAVPRATVSTIALEASPEGPQPSGQVGPTEETQAPPQSSPEATGDPTSGEAADTARGDETSGDIPWDVALTGSEALPNLTLDARSSLAATVGDWIVLWRGTAEGVAVSVEEAPEVTPTATRVRLRVEAPEATTRLEATIAPGGTWQVAERAGGTDAAQSEPHQISDTALLAGMAGEPVAAEVARQLAASGLEGAEGAWTTEDTVSWDGTTLRLTLWLPTSDAGVSRYEASFDTTVGLLEILPTSGEAA